jgi:hypothetical protein
VGVAASERVVAAMLGADLDLPRASQAIEQAVTCVDDSDIAELLGDCLDSSSALTASLIVGAATTTIRCLTLATELIRRSHGPEALAVTVAGLSLETADALTPELFDAVMPRIARETLARVARESGDHEVEAILVSVPAVER